MGEAVPAARRQKASERGLIPFAEEDDKIARKRIRASRSFRDRAASASIKKTCTSRTRGAEPSRGRGRQACLVPPVQESVLAEVPEHSQSAPTLDAPTGRVSGRERTANWRARKKEQAKAAGAPGPKQKPAPTTSAERGKRWRLAKAQARAEARAAEAKAAEDADV